MNPSSEVFQTKVCVVEEMNPTNQELSSVPLPGFVSDILHELSSSELRESLKSLLTSNYRDITCYRKQLSKLEMELSDVRSTVARVIDKKDNTFSSLKRLYDEDLTSPQSVTDHKITDSKESSKLLLKQKMFHWENQRNKLLADVNLVQSALQNSESARKTSENEHTTHHTRDSSHNGSTADPISCTYVDCDGCGSNQAHPSLLSPDSSSEVNQIERYENEIARLRRMLEDCRLGYEGDDIKNPSPQITACQPTSFGTPFSGTASDKFDESTSTAVVRTPENGARPLTELDWLKLNAPNKDTVLHSSDACAMCKNYEQLLQEVQAEQRQNERNLEARSKELSEKSVKLASASERQMELEEILNSRVVAQSAHIEHLESSLSAIKNRLENVVTNYQAHRSHTENELNQLSGQCKALQNSYNILQSHYDALLGRRSKAAAELSAQPILLPNDKSELELLALRLHEENLGLREAREHLDECLQNNSQLHEQQLANAKQKRRMLKETLQREIDEANARLASLSDIVHQRDKEVAARAQVEDEVLSLKTQIIELKDKLAAAESDAVAARSEATTLQQRLICLQTDLDNAESVQADFVRLSQNLQIQLEKLRQQEHEVRWIDPDDASSCFACHTVFPSRPTANNRKANCRHCGKVYCSSCLKHTVPSSPNGRPVNVCDVCHTLLNKHVAPYFSTGFHDQFSSNVPQDSPGAWRRHSSTLVRSQSP